MRSPKKKPVLLIALGGNALIAKGQEGTIEEQLANLRVPIRQIARLSRTWNVIVTHGNGPQVGQLLLQQESGAGGPKLPLEILVAQTQGQMGYMIESTLDSELMDLGVAEQPLVSLISYVVVDEKDPAFQAPTKPIGPVIPEDAIGRLSYPVRMTAKGYRRVVPSPEPVTIVEKREIRKLIQMGFIVICCGGGGIPVIREGRSFCGVDAVIDKDLASARLAEEVGVDLFVMATDVPGVAIHYGTAEETFLERMDAREAKRWMAEGHFSAGSMRPKVDAALRFVENSGRRAVITAVDAIEAAVEGRAGTQIRAVL